jgi:uncharacterized protein (DUF58 family)
MNAKFVSKIDSLEFIATQIVDGVLAGRHPSPRSGFSVEFAHHREYTPGDDIRHLDWKVFGRTERYQLKQYEQETNLVAWLLVDASESMRYGSLPDGRMKFDTAAQIAYGLAYVISQQSDSVGFAAITNQAKLLLKPSTAASQTKRILHELAAGPTTDVGQYCRTVDQIAGRLGSRGIAILISDFLDDPEELSTAIRHIRHFKNEVIVVHVIDPAELDFPFRHPTEFRGLEALGKLATDPIRIREHYLSKLNAHLTAIENLCRDAESDYLRIRCDADIGDILGTYLRRRTARAR